MNKQYPVTRKNRTQKVVCTVSAAALMLGVSEAATVGLHFQVNYCAAPAYSGFPVTLTAFGIAPGGWENLPQMDTGYGCGTPIITLNQTIDTTTSSGGLNPLPNGSLTVTWTANGANFSGFAGYAGNPATSYAYDGPPPSTFPTGEWEIYSSFLRDGVNFGIDTSGAGSYTHCGDNSQPVYLVDVTGLKSVFTNTPFVVQLIAGSDSMQTLTNAFIIDVPGATTNSVIYPSTPLPYDEGGTCSQWLRGHGGGLSTVSGALNTDHIQIMSNHPQHGGTGTPPSGFDEAGTISGFIVTDKPVVSMPPQSLLAGPKDKITLSAYAIGVPPLAYQWRLNGNPLPGATNLSCVISNLTASLAGNYDLLVTNNYGSTTSQVSVITLDKISMTFSNDFVADTNPNNAPRVGIDYGATWLASDSDGTVTRTGVMQFVALDTNEIVVAGATNFNTTTGTITFWMRSAGTDTSANGSTGAALFGQGTSTTGNDFIIAQSDGGNIYFNAPNGNSAENTFVSTANISDDKWHLIALSFDQSGSGGVALYIDGVLDTTNANIGAWSIPAGAPIDIGSSSDPFWRSYDGLLDDVRFYSRELSASEITSIYSSGALVDTANLQMRLNFDAPPGYGFTLSWKLGSAILQSATSVTGPYTDVIAAPSPFSVVPIGAQRFYRYRFVGEVLTSNPYLM